MWSSARDLSLALVKFSRTEKQLKIRLFQYPLFVPSRSLAFLPDSVVHDDNSKFRAAG